MTEDWLTFSVIIITLTGGTLLVVWQVVSKGATITGKRSIGRLTSWLLKGLPCAGTSAPHGESPVRTLYVALP